MYRTEITEDAVHDLGQLDQQVAQRLLTRHPRLGCLLWLLASCLLFLLLMPLTSGLWLPAIGRWLDAPSNPAPADAIAVLAGNRPRLEQAVALYQQGLAPEIWYTGDAPQGEESFSHGAQDARLAAIELGVPAAAITLLPTTSTWEDGEQITALAKARGYKRILVVTSWYHARRGVCIVRRWAQGSDIQITFQSAYNKTFGPEQWWRNEEGLLDVSNEIIKFGFYWVQYGLAPWQC